MVSLVFTTLSGICFWFAICFLLKNQMSVITFLRTFKLFSICPRRMVVTKMRGVRDINGGRGHVKENKNNMRPDNKNCIFLLQLANVLFCTVGSVRLDFASRVTKLLAA